MLLFVCCSVAAISFAQKETFELFTFTPPKGDPQVNEVQEAEGWKIKAGKSNLPVYQKLF